jgi:3-hydroxyacyl-[acyl-carrier-protein] dehydratase
MRYLMVDRIERVEPDRFATGWKNVAMSEDYLEWHFPGRPILPGVLVLEACVQLAGWLEAASSGFQRWFLVDRVVSARYHGFSLPGDRLDLRIDRVETTGPERRAFRGEASVHGERRASLEFEGIATDVARLEDPARLESLYRVLLGESPMEPTKGTPR